METENDTTLVFLSLIGFPSVTEGNGEYRLYVVSDDKKYTVKEIGRSPVSCSFSVVNAHFAEKGVSAGLWLIKENVPLLIAYQKSDDARLTRKDYSAIVINDVIEEKKLQAKQKKTAAEKVLSDTTCTDGQTNKQANERTGADYPADVKTPEYIKPRNEKPQELPQNPPRSYYDDEAVVTENYYKDDVIQEKLAAIKEYYEEHLRTEDDAVKGAFDDGKLNDESENADFITDNGVNGTADDCTDESETDGANEKANENADGAPYYLKVKDELDRIFARFPREETLCRAYEKSQWAKIFYGENKYYVVGLIKENGKEKYICYGVPSSYSPTPPKQLEGFCSFVPLSVFDLKGDGYFMMFQDAVTGKCIHIDR